MTFNGSKFDLFRDGRLLESRAFAVASCGVMLKVGIAQGGHGRFHFFRGMIDEVRISSVARYDKDFVPAARHEPDEDTLALYHFDEGEGDVVKDSSGNNHHGTKVGQVKWVKSLPYAPPTSAKSPEAAK